MHTNIYQFCEGRLLFKRSKSESPKSESEKEEKGSEKEKDSKKKKEEKPGSSERLQQKIGEVTNALANKLPDFIKNAKDVFANGTKKAADAAVATVVRTAEGIFIKTAKDKWQQMSGGKAEKKTISDTDMDALATKPSQSGEGSPNTSASAEDRIGKFLEGDQFTKFMAEFSRLLVIFMKVLSGDFNIPDDLLKRENFLGKQASKQQQELKDVQAQQRILGNASPQQKQQLQAKEQELQKGLKDTQKQIAVTREQRAEILSTVNEMKKKLPPGFQLVMRSNSPKLEFKGPGDVIDTVMQDPEVAKHKRSGFALAINRTKNIGIISLPIRQIAVLEDIVKVTIKHAGAGSFNTTGS